MEASVHLSRAELKRKIEALKKEVARKEKKLRWLERVSRNRSNTTVGQQLKRQYSNTLQKQETVDCRKNESENETSKNNHTAIHSGEHFKENKCLYIKDSTHGTKVVFNAAVHEEHMQDTHSHNVNTGMDEMPDMIVHNEGTDHKNSTQTEINNVQKCDKLAMEIENIVDESEKEIPLEGSMDVNAKDKISASESNQDKENSFSEERCINEAESPKCSVGTPLRRSARLAECKQSTNSPVDQTSHDKYVENKPDSETHSLLDNMCRLNGLQSDNDTSLKKLFTVLEREARMLNNTDFVLPDEEYSSFKLEVLTKKPVDEVRNADEKLQQTPLFSEKMEDKKDASEASITAVTCEEEIHNINHSESLVFDSALKLEESIYLQAIAGNTESSLILSPQSPLGKHDSHSSSGCISSINNKKEQVLSRVEESEETLRMNNKMSSSLPRDSAEVLDLEKNKLNIKDDEVKTSVKLISSLKADSVESVKKMHYHLTAEGEQYILIQHITEVSIWNYTGSTWLHKLTFNAETNEEVVDSCLLQKSKLYFSVILNCGDGCIMKVYTFDPEAKCLGKFFSEANPFNRAIFCKLTAITFAVAYSMPHSSKIYVYSIEQNTSYKGDVCNSHLITSVEDCIISLLEVDNLPYALLSCCTKYLYIWNSFTRRLASKIYLGNDTVVRNCCRAYHLKDYYWAMDCTLENAELNNSLFAHIDYKLTPYGLLFLVMVKDLKQQTEPCLMVLNPVTSKNIVLRRYGILKDSEVHSGSFNARGCFVGVLNDCEVTVYNLFTEQDIAHVKDSEVTSVLIINELCVVMAGLKCGTTHCYQII